MKITAILLCVLILLTSCAKPNVNDNAELDFSNITVTVSDLRANSDGFTVNTAGECSIRLPGGTLDYKKLAISAGIPLEVKGLTEENRAMKILAQDSDVDIYLMTQYDVKRILDNKVYEPIESDVIKDFVGKTFSPLQELCIDESGNVIMMPIEYSIQALYVPKKAVEELNIKAEDIEYLDDYLEFLRDYDGDRECYGALDSLFQSIEDQYNYYFCDFEKGEFDYSTDTYRGLYADLLGNWEDGITPWYYRPIIDDSGDINENLFRLASISSYINQLDLLDLYDEGFTNSFFNEYVSFPIPKISEKVDKNVVSVTCFAYINPYSKNKEAAVKVLEEIANNYFGTISPNCSHMIFSDTSMYPAAYDTDSQVFKEFVEMSNDSVIFFYGTLEERNDVWNYIDGTFTLDEAIAERTRVVNIMLNE